MAKKEEIESGLEMLLEWEKKKQLIQFDGNISILNYASIELKTIESKQVVI